MKTITNEIKAKYFALYYNQMYESDGYSYCLTGERLDNILCGERGILQLTSLENISDEDAIEVAKILSEKCKPKMNVLRPKGLVLINTSDYKMVSIFYDGTLMYKDLNGVDCYTVRALQAYQYLQSKGYALPYLDYSVNDLIEIGLIKLK